MRLDGDIRIGEASAWAARACKPLSGHPWPLIVSNIVGAVVAVVPILAMGALQSASLMPDWMWLFTLAFAVAASIWATLRVHRAMSLRRFKAALADRGVPNPLAMSMEITHAEIIFSQGVTQTRAPLSAVSDVSRIGPYWVLLVQGGPQFVPSRIFTT